MTSKTLTQEEKKDIPSCLYCTHCKIVSADGGCAFYYCASNYKIDGVTGAKVYSYCIAERYGKKCNFEPSFFTK